jgi:hypothetical protein
MAGRAGLPEVQVLGGLADEPLERIIWHVLEDARAKGRDELKQARLPSDDLIGSTATSLSSPLRRSLSAISPS